MSSTQMTHVSCVHHPVSRNVRGPASAAVAFHTTNAPRPRTSREELGVCDTRLKVLV